MASLRTVATYSGKANPATQESTYAMPEIMRSTPRNFGRKPDLIVNVANGKSHRPQSAVSISPCLPARLKDAYDSASSCGRLMADEYSAPLKSTRGVAFNTKPANCAVRNTRPPSADH